MTNYNLPIYLAENLNIYQPTKNDINVLPPNGSINLLEWIKRQILLRNLALGGGFHKEFVFDTPSNTWTATHNFGVKPAVTLIGSDNKEFLADLSYPDDNTVIATMSSAITGRMVLNAGERDEYGSSALDETILDELINVQSTVDFSQMTQLQGEIDTILNQL